MCILRGVLALVVLPLGVAMDSHVQERGQGTVDPRTGYRVLHPGQAYEGVRLAEDGTISFHRTALGKLHVPESAPHPAQVWISPPSPRRGFVYVVQYHGDEPHQPTLQGAIVHPPTRRVIERAVIFDSNEEAMQHGFPITFGVGTTVSWSPDERYAVVEAMHSDGSDLRVIDLRGSRPMQFVNLLYVVPAVWQEHQMKSIDAESLVWESPTRFRVYVPFHCSPYVAEESPGCSGPYPRYVVYVDVTQGRVLRYEEVEGE